MSAVRSTSSPYRIAHYYWNCGQPNPPAGQPAASNCVTDQITPSFLFVHNRNSGPPTVYTVTLTIEDERGNTDTTTTTVTLTSRY
jgi:hypothetical protein